MTSAKMLSIYQIVSSLVMFSLVMFVLASNGAFIAIIAQNTSFRKLKNILMCSLALSNILSLCVIILLIVLKSGFGFTNDNIYVCAFVSTGVWFLLWMNFCTCFLLSLEQFISIKAPIWHHVHLKSAGVGFKIVAYTWLLSLAGWMLFHLMTNPFEAWLLQPNLNEGCLDKLGYFLLALAIVAIMITCFVGYVNSYILYVSSRINKGNSQTTSDVPSTSEDRNAAKVVCAVVINEERLKKASKNVRRFLLIYISFIFVNVPVLVLGTMERMFPYVTCEPCATILFLFTVLRTVKVGVDPLLFSYKDVKLRKAYNSYMLCGLCRK